MIPSDSPSLTEDIEIKKESLQIEIRESDSLESQQTEINEEMGLFFFRVPFKNRRTHYHFTYYNIFIMDEGIEKQMAATNRKDKIFNVRKVHYKQYEHYEKYQKPQFSPFQVKQNYHEPASQKVGKKAIEYNFQVAIVSSAPYKELNKKFHEIKEEQMREKEKRLQQLKEKEQQLLKYEKERERLASEREKLTQKRDDLRNKIQEIRNRNQMMRHEQMQRNQEYRILSMEYLRNMLMGMRYQNGIEIDIDNMSYQELMQLEQKMGSVSKGLTQQQYNKLTKRLAGEGQGLCSICYDDVAANEQILTLPCKHVFHTNCIKEWLVKQKVCPMCKQQIVFDSP